MRPPSGPTARRSSATCPGRSGPARRGPSSGRSGRARRRSPKPSSAGPTSGDIRWPLLDRLRVAGRPRRSPRKSFGTSRSRKNRGSSPTPATTTSSGSTSPTPTTTLTLDQFLRAGTRRDRRRGSAGRRPARRRRLPRAVVHQAVERPDAARPDRPGAARPPELLILDDPFLGLDAGGRAELATCSASWCGGGLRLVLICRPEAVPGWVTQRAGAAGDEPGP